MAERRVTGVPPFLWTLITRLRRRGLGIGVDDCDALRAALAAGHGLRSDAELLRVCCALWAKSTDEVALISAAFAGVDVPSWRAETRPDEGGPEARAGVEDSGDRSGRPRPERARPRRSGDSVPTTEVIESIGVPPDPGGSDPSLFLKPRYPLSSREIAQVWRRLSRPGRGGPLTEVDAVATLDRLSRSGVATPPVLVPGRVNWAGLLLLVDRGGSMSPYGSYLDHLVRAIRTHARLVRLDVRFFHDVPGVSADRGLLSRRSDRVAPQLDSIISDIRPLTTLRLYRDPDLASPTSLDESELASYTTVAVVSDAGAARARFDGDRLVDTIALGRALRRLPRTSAAWLNPVAPPRWEGTTAEQVARHLPMFPLTRDGMTRAVEVLRGRPPVLARPL